MEETASHKYIRDCNTGTWQIQSKHCSKETPDGQTCCSKCGVLGEPTKIQRTIMKFASKYYLAMLLNRRLFGSPEEVDAFIKQVDKTTYGQKCFVYWGKMSRTPTAYLQRFIRNSFTATPPQFMTKALEHFMFTVVNPCLKVNVASVDNHMNRLSARFVTALAGQQLTDTCAGGFR